MQKIVYTNIVTKECYKYNQLSQTTEINGGTVTMKLLIKMEKLNICLDLYLLVA